MSAGSSPVPTIVSMTGFARAQAQADAFTVQAEARCVNGRSSDIKLRMPSGFEHLEKPVRALFQAVVRRGNANITLSVQREATRQPRINTALLKSLRAQLESQAEAFGEPVPPLANLLGMPGVVEMVDPASLAGSDAAQKEQDALVLECAEACAVQLGQARADEGLAMQSVLDDLVNQIASEVSSLAAHPDARGEHLQTRLIAQMERLLADALTLEPQRLHQEVALLASKADIEEELARLRAHIDAARELLVQSEPAGRKLDFLAQEFNREANTICSKASSIAITQHGLTLKALIDQVKEQVQNVE